MSCVSEAVCASGCEAKGACVREVRAASECVSHPRCLVRAPVQQTNDLLIFPAEAEKVRERATTESQRRSQKIEKETRKEKNGMRKKDEN